MVSKTIHELLFFMTKNDFDYLLASLNNDKWTNMRCTDALILYFNMSVGTLKYSTSTGRETDKPKFL
jgi:hypothetical protein